MKLSSNNLNIRYNAAYVKNAGIKGASLKEISPSFNGVQNVIDDVADAGRKKIAPHLKETLSGILSPIGSKIKKVFEEQITRGIDSKYENADEIFGILNKNFGSTFDDCLENIDKYTKNAAFSSGKGAFSRAVAKSGFSYTFDREKNTITFHKTSFARNVLSGVKEFTAGTLLDICVWGRKWYRKGAAKLQGADYAPKKISAGFNKILDDRILKKQALDSFYKLSGVFEQATEGLENFAANNSKISAEALKAAKTNFVKKNVENLAQESVQMASKKVGKYNTKTERAFNRLGTGFVSASFAATDFYNISMLQNDDKDKANASGRKRFAQDMRRQGLTAGITYIILGAFQNKVNKSIPYAVLSLGGVTLLSEILSRKMGGISLRPLSPEDAAKAADKREEKKLEKAKKQLFKGGAKPEENKKQEEKSQTNNLSLSINKTLFDNLKENNKDDFKVFDMFTKKLDTTIQNTDTTFTSKGTLANNETKKEDDKKTNKKSILSVVLKVLGGIVGASLAIGYLRSKNILNLDTIIKTASKKYNSAVKDITSKRLIMPKNQVDNFLDYLKTAGFEKQSEELTGMIDKIRKKGVLTGQSSVVQEHLKSKAVSDMMYYDMGKIDSKSKRALVNFILYPINTISRIFKNTNNVVKKIFVKEPKTNKTAKVSQEVAASFIKQYSEKYQRAVASGNLEGFNKEMQNAFSRHFSEANSKNKNTSIAMISRFLITLISGYFFVNDYRNEVLIESRGKDTERAKATTKERIGHKVANFFLNSMFMDIFNTTFENIYLSSVLGATAVSMATEFTNESAVRASICTPTKKMNKEQLIEYENKRLNDKGPKGQYYRAFMKLTGKKPLSEKANKN